MSNFNPSLVRKSSLLAAALILSGGLPTVMAASAFTQPDSSFNGNLMVRTQPVYAGSEVELAGRGFKPEQQVILLRGDTRLTSEALVADAEGNVSGKISVPADAAAGTHPVIMQVSGPDAASIINLKISPNIPLSGDNLFNIESASLPDGLYQSAYSPRNNALFVTRAVGRPPISQSEILKLDPNTLEILARVTPPVDNTSRTAPAGGPGGAPAASGPGVYGVYGIGVDDRNGNVWVTNTRQNTVAVYRQADLSLVKQFPNGTVSHSFEAVVDEARNRVYVSAATSNHIAVLNAGTLEFIKTLTVPTEVRARGTSFGTMTLSLDSQNARLYTVSLNTPELAVINTRTNEVERVIALPGAERASGVAWNRVSRQVGVVSQGSDNLLIINPATGEVVHDIPVGAGPLRVEADPASGYFYVSNRGSDSITVVTPEGRIIANLDGGSFPNHVVADGKGNIFAVNKARGADDARGDFVRRISLK